MCLLLKSARLNHLHSTADHIHTGSFSPMMASYLLIYCAGRCLKVLSTMPSVSHISSTTSLCVNHLCSRSYRGQAVTRYPYSVLYTSSGLSLSPSGTNIWYALPCSAVHPSTGLPNLAQSQVWSGLQHALLQFQHKLSFAIVVISFLLWLMLMWLFVVISGYQWSLVISFSLTALRLRLLPCLHTCPQRTVQTPSMPPRTWVRSLSFQ